MMFLAPQWLWLFLILFYMYYKRRTTSAKIIMLYMAMSMILLALARPVFYKHKVEVETKGSDVIIALDISYSMQADDLKPNRLEAAKALLKTLVKRDVNDRFGVIAFTTNAIILSPLTKDSELLLNLVSRVDENMVMTKGTTLLPALQLARKMSKSPHPKVLLLTDGGDADSYAVEAAYAKEVDLQINVCMMATVFGTTLKYDDGSFVKDAQHNIVVSSENRAIKALSDTTGGEYLSDPDVSDVMAVLDAQYHEDFKGKTNVVQYSELFYFFIILALLFFMLAYTTLRKKLYKKIGPLLLLLGVSSQAGVLNFYYLSQANQNYEQQNYTKAADYFSKIKTAQAMFNTAVSRYKEGKYEEALLLFSTIKSNDITFKASLYYNTALCYIRLKEFEKARENLLKSLALQDDRDAYENYIAILHASNQEMITGQQKGKKRADEVTSASSQHAKKSKKLKEGGGSNMNVTATSSNSASNATIKARCDTMLSFSKSGAKLSSKQYELINQRSVNETTPW
jgi:Ca-activated chloride channel family protein